MAAGREALQARLRALFVEELEDNVRVLNGGLLALERGDASADHVQELFRAAHSLKGAAHSAGVPALETLCHRLEDVLGRVRDGVVAVDRDALEPLFAAVDALVEARRQLGVEEDVPGALVADAVDGLARLAAGRAAAHPAPPPADRDRLPADGALDSAPATVRVAPARLESLLNQAGELLVVSNRVHTLAADLASAADTARSERALPLRERLEALARTATATDRALSQAGQAVVESARAASMLPFAEVSVGLDRVVRDLAAAEDKHARLVVEGADVELDRPIVSALREPLLHLVRNAVAHGIEPPPLRARAGKPGVGTVTVAATLHSDAVEVTVVDDGAGVDVAALQTAAERRGVSPPADDPLELVFAPGVSTAPLVTEVAGRGIGMDAVRARVEALGGSARVHSQPGGGTRVALRLPLTLSTLRVVLATTADLVVGLPTTSVARLLRAPVDDVRTVDGRETLLVDGRPLPVVSLARAVDAVSTDELRPGETFEGVVTQAGAQQAVLVVAELLDEREVVMKPLGQRLAGLPWALGGTVLADGRIGFILNVSACVRAGLGHGLLASKVQSAQTTARVLLVEDTFTTRALERSILEAAGYDVVTAVDGFEAWQLLQEQQCDLVVTDVQMPRMDGFALCEAIRASARLHDLPVMLVTSLGSEDDRRRGIEVGANAYIVKSAFEQPVLLDTIERLL